MRTRCQCGRIAKHDEPCAICGSSRHIEIWRAYDLIYALQDLFWSYFTGRVPSEDDWEEEFFNSFSYYDSPFG